MIQFEKVLGAFSLLADLDEAAARENSTIVEMAMAEVSVMLKSGACTAQTHDRLSHACAALAYYKYTVIAALRENSFTVGDIKFSVHTAETLAMAKQLKDDALGAIADLIENDGFAFVQV